MAARSDWDINRERGENVEKLYRHFKTFAFSDTTEVKCDDKCWQTGNVYIEYECLHSDQLWHASGIRVTKAERWCIYVLPTFIVMPTRALRVLAEAAIADGRTGKMDLQPNPTRGAIIPVGKLIVDLAGKYNAPIERT